jgi:hypothetical protein
MTNDNSKKKIPKDAACERCGSFEVFEIAGQFLCADCVATAGCGCAGHGESDLD